MKIPITDIVALAMIVCLLVICIVVGFSENAYKDSSKKRDFD